MRRPLAPSRPIGARRAAAGIGPSPRPPRALWRQPLALIFRGRRLAPPAPAPVVRARDGRVIAIAPRLHIALQLSTTFRNEHWHLAAPGATAAPLAAPAIFRSRHLHFHRAVGAPRSDAVTRAPLRAGSEPRRLPHPGGPEPRGARLAGPPESEALPAADRSVARPAAVRTFPSSPHRRRGDVGAPASPHPRAAAAPSRQVAAAPPRSAAMAAPPSPGAAAARPSSAKGPPRLRLRTPLAATPKTAAAAPPRPAAMAASPRAAAARPSSAKGPPRLRLRTPLAATPKTAAAVPPHPAAMAAPPSPQAAAARPSSAKGPPRLRLRTPPSATSKTAAVGRRPRLAGGRPPAALDVSQPPGTPQGPRVPTADAGRRPAMLELGSAAEPRAARAAGMHPAAPGRRASPPLDYRRPAPPDSVAAAAEPAPRPAPPAPPAPVIDIDALSRDVISRIEKRLRIERERHGRI